MIILQFGMIENNLTIFEFTSVEIKRPIRESDLNRKIFCIVLVKI